MYRPLGGGFVECLELLFHARMPTEVYRTTSKPELSSSEGCPKCSSHKQSGKLSCCAGGGAWFKKCGDFGNSNFDHTWVEGIQACKGRSPKVLILLVTLFQCESCHRNGFVVVTIPRRHSTHHLPTVTTSVASLSSPASSSRTVITSVSAMAMTIITTAGTLV